MIIRFRNLRISKFFKNFAAVTHSKSDPHVGETIQTFSDPVDTCVVPFSGHEFGKGGVRKKNAF
jgi:hypothetical protein